MNNNTHAEEMDHPKEHQSNWINPLGLLRDISNIQDPHKKIELIMNVFKINYEGIKRNGKTIRNLIEELRPIYDILSETGKIDLNGELIKFLISIKRKKGVKELLLSIPNNTTQLLELQSP